MYYYCSAPGCGNRIEYQITKPSSCPKCKTVFADLGKVVAAAKPISSTLSIKASRRRELEAELESLNEEEGTDKEEHQSLSNQVSASKQAILKRARARKLAERGELDEEDDEIEDTEELDYESSNDAKIKRLAEELAASIDPSTIRIIGESEGDGPDKISFRDWCAKERQ